MENQIVGGARLRSRSVKVKSPDSLFVGWAYSVFSHHYPTFGVAKREFQKEGKKTLQWSILEPRVYSFEVGDIYYLAAAPERVFLQVAAMWPDGRLEVHSGEWYRPGRSAQLVTAAGFAQWLQHGAPPEGAEPVFKGLSKAAGPLAYQLPQ